VVEISLVEMIFVCVNGNVGISNGKDDECLDFGTCT